MKEREKSRHNLSSQSKLIFTDVCKGLITKQEDVSFSIVTLFYKFHYDKNLDYFSSSFLYINVQICIFLVSNHAMQWGTDSSNKIQDTQ